MKELKCGPGQPSGFIQKFGIDRLDVNQRIALIEEIWATIDAEAVDAELLTDAQRAEFEMRLWDENLDDEDLNDLWEIEELLAHWRTRN